MSKILSNKLRINLIVFSLLFNVFSAYSSTIYQFKKKVNMNVKFVNISSEKIKTTFLEVFNKYKNLHAYQITIIQKNMGETTMEAQPIIKLRQLFSKKKCYKINMGEFLKDTDIKLSSVPKNVLAGWFAHELGHISDYENRSTIGMLWYAVKYVTSVSFKKKVEHTADYIALKKGFKKELLETKRYILLSELFSEKYLKNINTYYLPIEDVVNYIEENDDITLSKMYHE